MSEIADKILLIGVSSAFADRELFDAKVNTYISNLDHFSVIALNDSRGLVRGRFDSRVIDSVGPSMSMREKRKLVQAAEWIVFFWDGTGISDFVYLSRLYAKKARTIPVVTTRVVNKERGEDFDVYIGRGTPWGNPFAIGENGLDRAGAVEQFRQYFQKKFVESEEGRRAVATLRGKVLGCHCKPSLCHGDVIADYLNALESNGAPRRE